MTESEPRDVLIVGDSLGSPVIDWSSARSEADRMPDGLHLSGSGAERVAGWTIDAIRPEWG